MCFGVLRVPVIPAAPKSITKQNSGAPGCWTEFLDINNAEDGSPCGFKHQCAVAEARCLTTFHKEYFSKVRRGWNTGK